ncbi:MAG: AEC family transporter [Roseburia sp.]|nr:AEC family transporter [Roseburia sp.]
MEKVITVLEIVMPIFVTILMGAWAKRKNKISEEASKGLQQFVMTFCLPCVLFNSCLTSNFGMESVTSMVLVFLLVLLSSLWSFGIRKKKYPYHNLPQIFSSQETGMLGIPLFMTLFGAAQAYRMGVLDIAQAGIAIPVIAILSTDTGANPSVGYVVKKVFQSPLLLMSLLGLALNVTGAMDALNQIGVGGIITEVTNFIAQPVSAVILFCVGYNFSLGKENRKHVFEICGWHFVIFAVICVIIQAILSFVPAVDVETRWAILLYCALPGSYLTASLGKTKEESAVAASVCSILTVVTLVIFCVVAAVVA